MSTLKQIDGIKALIFVMAIGLTGAGVYLFQQQKIERLQTENQVLQQQLANLQKTNAELQQTITSVSTSNTTLQANLQVVCRETQARFFVLLEQKLDDLFERDFTQQWQQICQSQPAPANPQP